MRKKIEKKVALKNKKENGGFVYFVQFSNCLWYMMTRCRNLSILFLLSVYILLFIFRILFSYILWNGRGRWFYFFLCAISSPNNTYWVIPLSTHFKVPSVICQASIFAFTTSFYFVSLVLTVFFFKLFWSS